MAKGWLSLFKGIKQFLVIFALGWALVARANLPFDGTSGFIIPASMGVSPFLGKYIKYLDNAAPEATVHEVLVRDDWKTLAKDVPSFGYGRGPIWVAVDVKNASAIRKWILDYGFIGPTRITFYLLRDGRVLEEHKTGVTEPISQRPVVSRVFALPFEVEPLRSVQFLIRFEALNPRIVPLKLYKIDQYQKRGLFENLAFGVFVGAAAVFSIVCLFMYYVLRHGSLLGYALIITPVTFAIAALYGFDQLIFMRDFPKFFPASSLFFAGLALSGSAFFAREFLELRIWNPLLNKILGLTALVNLTGSLLLFPLISLGSTFVFPFIIGFNALVIVFIGLIGWIKRYPYSGYFLLATGFMNLSAVIYISFGYGLHGNFLLAEFSPFIGCTVEMIVLAMGLAQRVSNLRQERDLVALKAIQADADLKLIRSRSDYQLKLYSLAQQVAHDIRSPVAALGLLLKQAEGLREDDKSLLSQSILRIREIAENISTKSKEVKAFLAASEHKKFEITNPQILIESTQPIPIGILVNQIVQEKNLILPQQLVTLGFQIEFRITPEVCACICDVDGGDFRRVVSNLLNNSVEALEKKIRSQYLEESHSNFPPKLSVEVNFSSKTRRVLVKVTDSGPGIPPEILKKLGTKGFSWGKEGLRDTGSGLGLYHARKFLKIWGGSLKIDSQMGKGTEVTLDLPLSSDSRNFVSELNLNNIQKVVVVDDESIIFETWKEALGNISSARHLIESLVYIQKPEDFFAEFPLTDSNKFNNTLFLVDLDFKNSSKTGLEILTALNEIRNKFLVTYRFEDRQVLDFCKLQKVKILPKEFIGFLPLLG